MEEKAFRLAMEMVWRHDQLLGPTCEDKDGVIVFSELFPEMEEKDNMPVAFLYACFCLNIGYCQIGCCKTVIISHEHGYTAIVWKEIGMS